jgi:creatinine amidohydrolase/Fe(II)-dependent formamide hydrolase-like protein
MAEPNELPRNLYSTPYALSRLTFREIARERERLGALILPLGGCEPYADLGSMGVASACAEALGAAVSAKLRLLLAPTLAYGCSTPYRAFEGAAGVKPRVLTNFLCETIRGWYLQGFSSVIIIDALADNGEAVDCALQRLKSSDPNRTAVLLSLQRDERIRAFIGNHVPGKELGRTEFGMLSMASFIDPGLVRKVEEDVQRSLPDPQRFRTWRKRGADPQQFRKIFPQASASSIAHRYDPDFGKVLFEYILQLLIETATPFFAPLHS